MESRVNYAVVGLFVILLGLALVGGVVWLTVGTEPKFYDTYRVYTRESVFGLNPKAAVRYLGVAVGQVDTIRIDPENSEQVELFLNIEEDTPVRTDTRAVLVTQGLTGLVYVELLGGNGPLLEPTEENPVPVIPSDPSLIKRLDDAFTKVMTQFDSLTDQLATLLSEDNRQAISQSLANVAAITGALAANSGALNQAVKNAAATLEDVAKISAELPPLLGRVTAGVATVENMAETFAQTSQSLKAAVEDSRRDLRRVAQNTTPELNALLTELRQLADTLQRFVQELERNPRILLFGRPSGQPGPGE